MRTTLLGSLLDVARATSPATPTASPSSSPAASTCPLPTGRNGDDRNRPSTRWRGISPASSRRRSPSRTGSAASRSARWCRRSWRGGGEPADFFALKGVLEALAGQLGVALAFEAGAEPFLHPGPRGAGRASAASAAGWIGELHPLVCREWDLEAAVGFEVDAAALVAAASAGEETYEDVTTFPAVHQDLAVVVPAEVAAAGFARRSSPAAASCCARPRSSTSTRASSSARGARAWLCGSSSAPPTAPSPTRRSPACATRSRPQLEEIGGTLRE